jgi:hypothetical protein
MPSNLSGHVLKLVILQAVNAITPLCKTWGPYLANRIIQGILSSPVEALCEISITDIVRNYIRDTK